MFNNCSSVLETTYKDFFHAQLKVGFTNTFTDLAQAYTAIQRRFQSSDNQTEKEKLKFLVSINQRIRSCKSSIFDIKQTLYLR